MALKGDLDTVTLAGILQLLCNENKTGILSVNNDKEEYQFYILNGSILYAIRAGKQARLGYLLLDQGLINQEQLKESLKIAKEEKKALGRVMLDQGFITFETLERFLFRQVLEITFNLFKWDKGEFTYNDGEFSLRWMVVVKLNTLNLIMEASSRLDEWRRSLADY